MRQEDEKTFVRKRLDPHSGNHRKSVQLKPEPVSRVLRILHLRLMRRIKQQEYAIFAYFVYGVIMVTMKSIHDPRYIKMINHLKNIRKSKEISQEILGERLQWKQQDISKVESFVRRLDFIELCDWLDALDYEIENFVREIKMNT